MLFLLLSLIMPAIAEEVPGLPTAAEASTEAAPMDVPPPPKARLSCATRLLVTSSTLTAGGLAMLGAGIAAADQGKAWEPWAIGGGIFAAGGLSVAVNFAPLVLRREPRSNLEC